MSVQPVASPAARVSQPAATGAPAPSAPSAPKPTAPSAPTSPAYAVTLSKDAKAAAAAHASAPPASDATKAARTTLVRAASTTTTAQTTTSGYVMKVRAALARGGDRNIAQIMASLGIPQAEQQQVALALGATPRSAQ